VAKAMIEHATAIVDLLTMKPSSRPAARKVNRKKKAADPVASPATA